MSGVSIDTGTSTEGDLAAIYTGGENFMARMRAMSTLRDEHQAAFLNLRMGLDAKAALGNAKSLESEAQDDRRKAADELSAARASAVALLAKANQEASQERLKAQAEAADVTRGAQARFREADAYYTDLKAKADKMIHDLEVRQADLEARLAAVQEAESAHLKAEQVHANAADAAKKLADDLKRKTDALHDVMRRIL